MKIKYPALLLLAASLFLVQCKKDVTGCTDSNAFNYDSNANINCCCEYTITYDPEGTGNYYTVVYKNESGSETTTVGMNNSWEYSYVATIGASVAFSVTNLSTDSTTTAKANIWKGDVLFKTVEVTGTGETATASGILN